MEIALKTQDYLFNYIKEFKKKFSIRVVCHCTQVTQSFPTLSNPVTAAFQAPLSMKFSSKNTGVNCHFLLQRIFLI